jgi:hypothetical protein
MSLTYKYLMHELSCPSQYVVASSFLFDQNVDLVLYDLDYKNRIHAAREDEWVHDLPSRANTVANWIVVHGWLQATCVANRVFQMNESKICNIPCSLKLHKTRLKLVSRRNQHWKLQLQATTFQFLALSSFLSWKWTCWRGGRSKLKWIKSSWHSWTWWD